MKRCPSCGLEKDLTEFEKLYDNTRPNRVRSKCKLCSMDRNLWRAAQKRAKASGTPFTITKDDITIPETCPVFGTKLIVGTALFGPDSPSLDRIRPTEGYVPGNVWVISHRANMIKSDATLAELEQLVAALRTRLGA